MLQRRPESTDLLPVVRASDLDEPTSDRCWLVESLWARAGVGLIGGAPKSCKSWLGLDLAFSIASSTPCLGRFAVLDPGPALVYLAEDSAAVVRQRFAFLARQRQLDLAALPLYVITAPSLRLDLNRDQQRLERTLAAFAPRLLLLDPFVRLHRINENDAGEVSGLLAFLRELQRKYDLAVVVVHHARKNATSGVAAGQGLRGSGDLHAWGDSNLYLRRQRNELVLTIEHRAAAAPDPITLALSADTQDQVHLEIADNPSAARSPDHRAAELDDEILRALAQTGPMRRDDLRAALRVRNERLGLALQRLVANGRLQRHGDRWLPPDSPIPSRPSIVT
jgi:hypothetical protein